MKKMILILGVFINSLSSAQNAINKFQLIQGIWANNINGSSNESLYKIIRGISSLGLAYENMSNVSGIYLLESFEGFQNIEEIDSVFIDSLRQDGRFFTTVFDKERVSKSGWVKAVFCVVPHYFECNGDNMSINGGKLMEYHKIDRLPADALKLLFVKGRQDNRNYIKEYLNINVIEIKKQKETIYSSPYKATNIQLNQGDVVTVIEQKNGWIKIDFGADRLGWIKK